MNYILETENLCKVYGKKKALDNVSIHVGEGDVYGLIGKNGAGKTTLMKIVGGLSNATSGTYTFMGCKAGEIGDVITNRGLLIEDPGVLENETGYENLVIKEISLGIKDKNEAMHLLEMVGLKDAARTHVKKYSFGMRQRLGLALAFVGNPGFVILDEPINGFDPQGINSVRELIKEKRRNGTTFLISSHILGELSKIATKYGFINEGKLLEESTEQELIEKCKSRIELVAEDTPKAVTILEAIGFRDYKVMENGMINIYEQVERTGDITNALAKESIATIEIVRRYEELEDYYMKLVGENEANNQAAMLSNENSGIVNAGNRRTESK